MRILTTIYNYVIEPFTKFFSVIQSDHAYVHKGLAYTSIIDTGSISASYKIGFTTPTVASGKVVHWRPADIGSTADQITFKLYSAISFSAGTAVAPFNRNQDDFPTETGDMQAFAQGVTATVTGGKVVDAGTIGSAGTRFSTSGGSGGSEHELVLIPNTSYVLDLVPADATVGICNLFWYEEDEA